MTHGVGIADAGLSPLSRQTEERRAQTRDSDERVALSLFLLGELHGERSELALQLRAQRRRSGRVPAFGRRTAERRAQQRETVPDRNADLKGTRAVPLGRLIAGLPRILKRKLIVRGSEQTAVRDERPPGLRDAAEQAATLVRHIG